MKTIEKILNNTVFRVILLLLAFVFIDYAGGTSLNVAVARCFLALMFTSLAVVVLNALVFLATWFLVILRDVLPKIMPKDKYPSA